MNDDLTAYFGQATDDPDTVTAQAEQLVDARFEQFADRDAALQEANLSLVAALWDQYYDSLEQLDGH